MSRHYLIFVHGMGEPQKPNQLYDPSFGELWKKLERAYGDRPQPFHTQFGHVYTNWHKKLPTAQASVTQAETVLFEAAFPEYSGSSARWFQVQRKAHAFTTFFIGDVIAYVSDDVNLIRRTVWEQLWFGDENQPGLCQILKEDPTATYSIVAHSLGSVIAFDYLLHLFQDQNATRLDQPICPFLPDLDTQERPEDARLTDSNAQTQLPDPTNDAIRPLLQQRFRYFFTLGSPIGLFMLRFGQLWLQQHPFEQIFNPVRGRDRGWYNFYDRSDIFAYPLQGLFQTSVGNQPCVLEDISVRNWGVPFAHSHTGYWNKAAVAQKMIDVLTMPRSQAVEPISPAIQCSPAG